MRVTGDTYNVIKIPIYLVFKFDSSNKYKFLKKDIFCGNFWYYFATFFECHFYSSKIDLP